MLVLDNLFSGNLQRQFLSHIYLSLYFLCYYLSNNVRNEALKVHYNILSRGVFLFHIYNKITYSSSFSSSIQNVITGLSLTVYTVMRLSVRSIL